MDQHWFEHLNPDLPFNILSSRNNGGYSRLWWLFLVHSNHLERIVASALGLLNLAFSHYNKEQHRQHRTWGTLDPLSVWVSIRKVCFALCSRWWLIFIYQNTLLRTNKLYNLGTKSKKSMSSTQLFCHILLWSKTYARHSLLFVNHGFVWASSHRTCKLWLLTIYARCSPKQLTSQYRIPPTATPTAASSKASYGSSTAPSSGTGCDYWLVS
jgi:hypothetical protein